MQILNFNPFIPIVLFWTFLPNCKGEVKLQILEKKTPQVHLIIIKEWPAKHPPPSSPPILNNLDNFPTGAFYSTTLSPRQLGTKEYSLKTSGNPWFSNTLKFHKHLC